MAMPFSTVFKPTVGNHHLLIPSGLQNGRGSYLADIPAGVSQIIVTWRGTEDIRIQLDNGYWETIHRIPAASSPSFRTSGVLTVSTAESVGLALVCFDGKDPGWSTGTLDKNYVAGVQVIPLATPGGV